MSFQFQRLQIPEVVLIQCQNKRDERGFFAETFKASEFASEGLPTLFAQDNHSRSIRGVLRGMHYQKNPRAQSKLIQVIAGAIFDVAVDLRIGSPTFARWVGETLTDDGCMLYIPPGFAHGFCVLSEQADLVYKVTAEYAPDLERGIVWNDPEISIRWPTDRPNLSPRDAQLPQLRDADNNFVYGEIE